jgi:diguanylate cyclase (GGDEF)-like protein
MSNQRPVAERPPLSTEDLGALELFRGEDPESLNWVLQASRVRWLKPGEVLMEPGRDNGALHIILAGQAEVRFTQDEPGSRVFLESGECVGEMSIIDGTRPSATVIANERAQVLVMDARVVWALIDRSPVVARNLLHILSRRMRRNNLALVQSHVQRRIHERDALNDPLTGLFNRRWMETNVAGIVEGCARSHQSLALFMIDADHFKRYNDEHGHLAGDQMLATIARAINRGIRSNDYACRYGGDEFVVVLPNAGPAEAMQIAEAVCRSVREQTARSDHDPSQSPVGVSIGVASLAPGMNVRQLLACADAALYRAKAAGRGGASR